MCWDDDAETGSSLVRRRKIGEVCPFTVAQPGDYRRRCFKVPERPTTSIDVNDMGLA